MDVILMKSPKEAKKYAVKIDKKTIHFGSAKHEDFTIHKDPERKQRYIARHKVRENWTKSGLKTAGFWSRWLLWNKSSIKSSIKDIERRFKIRIKLI